MHGDLQFVIMAHSKLHQPIAAGVGLAGLSSYRFTPQRNYLSEKRDKLDLSKYLSAMRHRATKELCCSLKSFIVLFSAHAWGRAQIRANSAQTDQYPQRQVLGSAEHTLDSSITCRSCCTCS